MLAEADGCLRCLSSSVRGNSKNISYFHTLTVVHRVNMVSGHSPSSGRASSKWPKIPIALTMGSERYRCSRQLMGGVSFEASSFSGILSSELFASRAGRDKKGLRDWNEENRSA